MTREMSQTEYEEFMAAKETEWEKRCVRCGACCGLFEDPCVNVSLDKEGKCLCSVYASRLGIQHTVSGKEFRCVPIRNIIGLRWNSDYLCAYKRLIRR